MDNTIGNRKHHMLMDETFGGLFVISLIGMLGGTLCPMIDVIVTGQFLGEKAIAATGLIMPLVSLTAALTLVLAMGTSQICTRAIGKADVHLCNQVFSTMLICEAALCLLAGAVLFLFAPQIAGFLSGGGTDQEVTGLVSDYLKGFAPGMLPSGLAVFINMLLALDNDRGRSLVYMLVSLLSDVVLDFANVLVFHGGMYGMALATSLSSMFGFVIILLHFGKKDRILRFTPAHPELKQIMEVLKIGFAGVLAPFFSAFTGLANNYVVSRVGGTTGVAALSVATSALVLYTALISSLHGTVSSLSGLAYGEEDREGLVRVLRRGLRMGYGVCLMFFLLFVLFAYPISGIFLRGGSAETHELAAWFLRFIMIGFLFQFGTHAIGGSFVGTDQLKLNYLLIGLRDAFLPILFMLSGGLLFGMGGIEVGFVLRGVFSLLSCFVLIRMAKGRLPASIEDFLVIPDSFLLAPEELFEASMDREDEITQVSEKVRLFFLERKENTKNAMLAALFVEEMAANTFKHGFKTGQKGSIEVRAVIKADKRMIRLRDNGAPFDPVKWLELNHPEDPAACLGIRMVVPFAKSVKHVPTMNLNNLIVEL